MCLAPMRKRTINLGCWMPAGTPAVPGGALRPYFASGVTRTQRYGTDMRGMEYKKGAATGVTALELLTTSLQPTLSAKPEAD